MRFVVLMLCFAICCFGQLKSTQPSAAPSNSSRPWVRIVDGAKEPDNVPDGVAWLMLFATISDGPNAPAYVTRAAFMRGAGLTEDQVYKVIASASHAERLIRDMELNIKAADMNMEAKTTALRQGRDKIVTATVDELMSALGYDGAQALRKHLVTSVKSRIKMELPQD